jgi:mRNA interferase MazF
VRRPGQIGLLKFPEVDLIHGKNRPVLLLAKVPGLYEDWLVCMLSSQLQQGLKDFDEIIHRNDEDFQESGLKVPTVIRIGRLAVVSLDLLIGSIGSIDEDRLLRIKKKLAEWIFEGQTGNASQ